MNATRYRKIHNRQPGECTWCGAVVPAGRRTWCSKECVEAFRLEHDWQHIRRRVHERDGGICAVCGADCDRINRLARTLRWRDREAYRYLRDFYRTIGHHDVFYFSQWQADHIVERVRGGGHELENLRTLCLECHKRETARLAAERAQERRDAARSLLNRETL